MIRMDTSFDVRLCDNSAINQVDFNNIAFGKVFSDHVFVMDYLDGEWQKGRIEPYGPMSMSPASMVFHYGQAIFEGMKAYRQQDGNASLFRPGDNIKRFNLSSVEATLGSHCFQSRTVWKIKKTARCSKRKLEESPR